MKKLIGYCGVDSGSILIADPCYVLPDKEIYNYPEKLKEYSKEHADYSGIFTQLHGEKDPEWKNQAGEVLLAHVAGTGVLSHTHSGDGNYPVYAELDDNGKVKSLTIEFV